MRTYMCTDTVQITFNECVIINSVRNQLTSHHPLPNVVVMDIASVVGGYDMRRLNDITAFRRYWYRTSLVEALFIGTKKKSHEEASGASIDIPSDPEGEAKEPSAVVDLNDTLSAVIVVAANVDDLRVSTNVAQVMGNTE